MSKHKRVLGTTPDAIDRAEAALKRKFPPSFRMWLLDNNGLDIDGVHIYPVLDDRDQRKTWDSIVRNFEVGWSQWLENFSDDGISFPTLLPFADFGTGDYYCFDYTDISSEGEVVVVHWTHETGETEYRAKNFDEFVEKIRAGEFEFD